MFYTVIEIQESQEGIKSCIPMVYDNINQALNKLYTVLAAASVSELPYHSCYIIRSDGVITDGKFFDRHSIEQ